MTGPKLNEAPVIRRRPESRAIAVTADVPSAKAIARHVRVSPYKVRQVLDLIRGHETQRALDILRLCERDAAIVVGKILASAMANAEHNHAMSPEELFVSACFADEGPTLKRWRPRARGRATRIRKRTCHVTVIVSRLPETELRKRRAERAQAASGRRGGPRRTAGSSRGPDRAGRVRRQDGSPTSSPTPTPTRASAPAAEPEPPTIVADDNGPITAPDTITDAPEVRTSGPAAGDSGSTDDASSSDDAGGEDDTTSAGPGDDSPAAGSDKE